MRCKAGFPQGCSASVSVAHPNAAAFDLYRHPPVGTPSLHVKAPQLGGMERVHATALILGESVVLERAGLEQS